MNEVSAEQYRQWGELLIPEWLRFANAHIKRHGENILTKLTAQVDSSLLPSDFSSLPPAERISFLQRHYKDLFTPDSHVELAQLLISNPVLSERTYLADTVTRQKPDEIDQDLLASLAKIEGLESLSFILFTDGREEIFVKKTGKEYIFRIKKSPLSFEQVVKNLARLPDCVPSTEAIALEKDESGCRVILLTEKIPFLKDEDVEKEAMAGIAKELSEVGFVVDLNDLTNFAIDQSGATFYLDQDVFDYALSTNELDSSLPVRKKVEAGIAKLMTRSDQKLMD